MWDEITYPSLNFIDIFKYMKETVCVLIKIPRKFVPKGQQTMDMVNNILPGQFHHLINENVSSFVQIKVEYEGGLWRGHL